VHRAFPARLRPDVWNCLLENEEQIERRLAQIRDPHPSSSQSVTRPGGWSGARSVQCPRTIRVT